MMIGIFDSGMGGLSVLAKAKQMLPLDDFIYYGDSKYAPYGVQSKEAVVDRSMVICDFLIEQGVEAIVIACNTATSVAVKILREKYDIPIIGMEPAIKTALEQNHGRGIVVMATPMTLKEEKYKFLLTTLKTTQKIYEIPAPKVVELVEKGLSNSLEMTETLVHYFHNIPMSDVESIVLGCTHFLFIQEQLKGLFEAVNLIDGNQGTIQQLIRKTNKNARINRDKNHLQNITIINSAGESFVQQSKKILLEYEVNNGN